jgi:hypothetical protein
MPAIDYKKLFSVNPQIIRKNPITEDLALPLIVSGELRIPKIPDDQHKQLCSKVSTSLVKLLSAADSSYRFRGSKPSQSVTKHSLSSIKILKDLAADNSVTPANYPFLERCELPLFVHDLSETIVEPSSNGQMLEGLDIDDKNAFEQKLFKQLVRASFQQDFFNNILSIRRKILGEPQNIQSILLEFLDKNFKLSKEDSQAEKILLTAHDRAEGKEESPEKAMIKAVELVDTANIVIANPDLNTGDGKYLKGKIAEARERLDLHQPPKALYESIAKHLDNVIKRLA